MGPLCAAVIGTGAVHIVFKVLLLKFVISDFSGLSAIVPELLQPDLTIYKID